MHNRKSKSLIMYIIMFLAVVLISVSSTLALVTDEHNKTSTLIAFDKVAIYGHNTGSNLGVTLNADCVGNGEIVFNASGDTDYLWVTPSNDSADMFLRFKAYYTLGNEELDDINKESLDVLNNGNAVPLGFELYDEESENYDLVEYEGWVYIVTVDEANSVENRRLKVIQNSDIDNRKYILSNFYRLQYEDLQEDKIFNLIESNDNKIDFIVEVQAIQCFGLKNTISEVIEETEILNSSTDSIDLEQEYGYVTVENYAKTDKLSMDIFARAGENLVPNVNLLVTNMNTNETFEVTTNVNGKANLDVEAGTYKISVVGAVKSYLNPEDKIIDVLTGTKVDMIFEYVNPVFGQNSPSLISKISNIISKNNMTSDIVKETFGWNLGDTISIALTSKTITMRIIGFNHDDLSDGSGKAGITLDMTGVMGTAYKFINKTGASTSNSGGWNISYIRSTVLPDIKKTFPAEWTSAMKTVTKKAYISKGIGTFSETLFLFSEVELVGSDKIEEAASGANEGSIYEYYSKNGVTSFFKGSTYWLRSITGGYFACWARNNTSSPIFYGNVTNTAHISFGFCV